MVSLTVTELIQVDLATTACTILADAHGRSLAVIFECTATSGIDLIDFCYIIGSVVSVHASACLMKFQRMPRTYGT